MTLPVFIADCLAELRAGDLISLDSAETRHLTVKRIRAHEPVTLVDSHGWHATAVMDSTSEDTAVLRLESDAVEDVLPARRLTLIQALAKDKRDLQAVESACEIGVNCIIPWGAQRSVSRWDTASKRAKGLEKWRNLALSAMKQSRQSRVAEIADYTEDAAQTVADIISGGGVVFVLHEHATRHLADILSAAVGEQSSPRTEPQKPANFDTEIALVVGPEGSITEAEMTALQRVGAQPALLGPTVLRCSTAGPAALAVIQALVGSWRAEPLE